MSFEVGEQLKVTFDECGAAGAAADGLHADDAGSRENIEEGAIRDCIAEDAEEGFADHLRRRPQVAADVAGQLAATQGTSNYTDLSAHENSKINENVSVVRMAK
jgi:hypothetical protein